MLTSEQAKNQLCPHMRDWARDMDSGEIFYEHINCRGNKCPKWRTIYVFNHNGIGRCPYESDGEGVLPQQLNKCLKKHEIDSCSQCPEAFGYCGG